MFFLYIYVNMIKKEVNHPVYSTYIKHISQEKYDTFKNRCIGILFVYKLN